MLSAEPGLLAGVLLAPVLAELSGSDLRLVHQTWDRQMAHLTLPALELLAVRVKWRRLSLPRWRGSN